MRSRGINKRLALASRICFVLSRLISSRAINIFTTLYILHVHHQRRSKQHQVNNQSVHSPTTHHNSKYALLHLLRRALCGCRLRSEQRCQHHRKILITRNARLPQPNNTSQAVVESTSTTAPYTNGFTSYLTQTNSLGVVTGMPAVDTAQSALPPAVTSQPEVATIPAGLPEGVTHIMQNISRSLTSFEVSVGSSTTVVIGAASGATIVTGTGTETGAAATASSSGSSSNSNNDDDSSSSGSSNSNSESSSASGSGAAESTGSADSSAGRVTLASAGVLGFGALIAAFL